MDNSSGCFVFCAHYGGIVSVIVAIAGLADFVEIHGWGVVRSGVIVDVVLALDLLAGAVMPPSARSHNKSLSAKSGYFPVFIPKNVELI